MTAFSELKIGDTVAPAQYRRGIVSGPEYPAPVWHALVVPPQREAAAREFLRGYRDATIYAFYPSQSTTRTIAGKRIEQERPIVSRMIYAQFHQQPQWDVIKARHRNLITGVYCNGSQPIIIPPDVIKRLQGLTVEADRLRQARSDMLRVREGDIATITQGPLTGFKVDITQVSGGIAWFTFLTGAKASASVASLERDVGLAQHPDVV